MIHTKTMIQNLSILLLAAACAPSSMNTNLIDLDDNPDLRNKADDVTPHNPPKPEPLSGTDNDKFLVNARAYIGLHYVWGGARLKKNWTAAEKLKKASDGDFYWGADCSGYVAKVWELAIAMPLEAQKHEQYYTGTFYSAEPVVESKIISESEVKPGDAFVRTGSPGHIFIVKKRDSWGKYQSYEAKGKNYGIVVDTRTVGSEWRAIRHKSR